MAVVNATGLRHKCQMSRDDFSKPIKRLLAERAGHCCSNPDCRRPTIGAAAGHEGTMNVGEAAHITAASPGGKRYDASLTPEQRRALSNGIWLCSIHAKMVDTDGEHFTVELLRAWKQEAEARSFNAIVTLSSGQHPDSVQWEGDDSAFGPSLGLQSEDDFETVTGKVHSAASADLDAFKGSPIWPPHAIELTIRRVDDETSPSFNAKGLARSLQAFREIAVIAPPGTGKSVTLLQAVEVILAEQQAAAIFVPLAEWSSGAHGFITFIRQRAAFQDVTEQHLMLLAHHGRLTLALDGWNELNGTARKKAISELHMLRRDFPELRIIVSTRRQASDVPVSGPIVEIDALSYEQQLEIARRLRGDNGEELLDHAWRTPGIRDLVSIPLYLSALVKVSPEGKLPSTKEEVIRLLVREHEQTPEKASELRETLSGHHQLILAALAVEATKRETTALTEADARKVVAAVSKRLVDADELTVPLLPLPVLDLLIAQHLLVSTPTDGRMISFQHQQFQEWHASFEVERLLMETAQGNAVSAKSLREDVLNLHVWEEAILFACERLSRADGKGATAVASAIIQTLEIDPLLAAEMIYRSSDQVWSQIGPKVTDFVARWHEPGTADRAVAFMISTGRGEFAESIWPLISHPNNQVHLAALRAARRFRPSVLGNNVAAEFAALPETLRSHIASEIAHRSGMDGMELAVSLAIPDPSPKVKFEVIEAVLFRRADRLALRILQQAPEEVWRNLAQKGYADEIQDPEATGRLAREQEAYLATETSLSAKLHSLVFPIGARRGVYGAEVSDIIKSADYPVKDQHGSAMIYEASKPYPAEVAAALLQRLEAGLEIPFRTEELIEKQGLFSESTELAKRVAESRQEDSAIEAAASVVPAGVVSELIERLIRIEQQAQAAEPALREPIRKEYWHVVRLLEKVRPVAFAEAVLRRPKPATAREIGLIADIVARHLRREVDQPSPLNEKTAQELADMAIEWAGILQNSSDATRNELADIARVAERVAVPSFLPTLKSLLDQDLSRWRQARAEFAELRNQGRHHESDARMSYLLQYQRAFAAIGTEDVAELMVDYLRDPDFGVHAANILRSIWARKHGVIQDKTFPISDYSEVPHMRAERAKQVVGSSTSVSDTILGAANELAGAADPKDQSRALELARVGFSLPYANRGNTIATLVALPTPPRSKLPLLATLVRAGEVVNADFLLHGIRTLFEDAKTEWWRLDANNNELQRWLELIPFSDNPLAIFDALALVPGHMKAPWQLRGLPGALRYAPAQEAETALKRLAEDDPRWLTEYEWIDAFIERGTASSLRSALELIYAYKPTGPQGRIDSWDIRRKVTEALPAQPEVKAELLERYKSLPASPGKTITAQIISELGDPEGVMLLVDQYAAAGQKLDGALSSALRKVAVGERPSKEWKNSDELYSVALPKLRKSLFAMTQEHGPGATLAIQCLNIIDALRDDYGPAEGETRHPDITSGRPWPIVRES